MLRSRVKAAKMRYRSGMWRFAKSGIACALRWTGAVELFSALADSPWRSVILGYHRVVADVEANADGVLPGMMISRQMLAQHLDWLGRSHRFVSLDELGERLARDEGLDDPLAAVTFDDGYQDVYEYAFPLLRERGVPAAVFVVTDLIGTSAIPLHDALYVLLAQAAGRDCSATKDLGRFLRELGLTLPKVDTLRDGTRSVFGATQLLLQTFTRDQLLRVVKALEASIEIDKRTVRALRPLTWQMVTEMSRAGFTVGSHTRTHVVLTREGSHRVLEEVAGSRRVLEQTLGIPVRHFAYPGGHFNRAVIRAVADSGYNFGYTTCRHRDPEHPFLTIPRMMMWEASCLDAHDRFSTAIMSCQIHGILNTRCRHSHGTATAMQPAEERRN